MLWIIRYGGWILALPLKGQSAHEFGCVEKLLSFAGGFNRYQGGQLRRELRRAREDSGPK
jgi:hypothetical protein